MGFTPAWILSAVALIAVYAFLGRSSETKSLLGVVIDNRNRMSLNHMQVLMWTILILSTLLAAFVSSGFDPVALEIPQELLVLAGISVGTAAVSGAVKSTKDADGSTAKVVKGEARPAQFFLEEEGLQANKTVNITKFQNFVFTIVTGVAFVVLTFEAQDYPVLPEQVVWLIGISHAGYVAGKLPNAG